MRTRAEGHLIISQTRSREHTLREVLIMSTKRKNKRIGVCLMAVTSCLIVAVLWAVLATPETALAKKPGSGGPSGETQDIPVSAVIDDQSNEGVSSDGGGAYVDKKKDHISAFVGRRAGQFILDTNTNNAEGGRTMKLNFSAVVDPLNREPLPPNTGGVVTPITAAVYTARARVTEQYGYVDLRAMEIGESKPLALRIRLTITDAQSPWDLSYGDVLWGGLSEGDDHYDQHMAATNYVTVTRLADTADGKKVWTIDTNAGTHAYLRRSEQWGPWIPVGVYSMPMSLTITEK